MKQKDTSVRQIKLKGFSKKELAEMYGISVKTLNTWLAPFLDELGPIIGRFYCPRQVKIIFEKLGVPEILEISS